MSVSEFISDTLVINQRNYFLSGITQSLAFRKEQLSKLYNAIKTYEPQILEALKNDLGKSEFEAYSTEIGFTLREISFAKKRIHKWMKPIYVRTPLTHLGSKGKIISEPYGVTLIISPSNYPFQLAIAPLVGAVAGGNTAIIKPSELAPNVSSVIKQMLQSSYSDDYISVVEGDAGVCSKLLEQKFDFIFFSGSTTVGKLILSAAAKQLTPVILELGCKCPVIVHRDAKIRLAAKRIAWGKFTNAGQSCIAPDFIYVHSDIKSELTESLKKEIIALYSDDPIKSESYAKIINKKQYERLKNFLSNGKIIFGGNYDDERLKISPAILTDISCDEPVMQEEIFGPILPILTYSEIEDVIKVLNTKPKPLALYIFSESKEIQNKFISQVRYGGGCINDTLYQIASPYLPYGGVGESGMGNYHGLHSFRAFTHQKSILKQTTLFDLKIRYPNFKNALKYVRKLLK